MKLESKCNNAVVKKSEIGVIRGMNPDRMAVMLEIKRQLEALDRQDDVEIMDKIVCQESRYTQFRNSDGMPYACNEMDIGLFQVRDVFPMKNHCRAAWDWKYNVSKGIEIYGWKKEGAKNHHKYELDSKYGANAKLLACMYRKLNVMIAESSVNNKKDVVDDLASKLAYDIRDKKDISEEVAELNSIMTKEAVDLIRAKVIAFTALPQPLDKKMPGETEFAVKDRLKREAIRRYNAGREYSFIPDDTNNCTGHWESDPKMTKNPTYVEDSLAWDPKTCK